MISQIKKPKKREFSNFLSLVVLFGFIKWRATWKKYSSFSFSFDSQSTASLFCSSRRTRQWGTWPRTSETEGKPRGETTSKLQKTSPGLERKRTTRTWRTSWESSKPILSSKTTAMRNCNAGPVVFFLWAGEDWKGVSLMGICLVEGFSYPNEQATDCFQDVLCWKQKGKLHLQRRRCWLVLHGPRLRVYCAGFILLSNHRWDLGWLKSSRMRKTKGT